MKKKKILAILPISIGGRLTTNSIIDGYRQNNCDVTVYDELFDNKPPCWALIMSNNNENENEIEDDTD